MPAIVKNARKHQPGLIVVDRWAPGEFENYLTPEQKIPEKALDYPWESCITMADGWSYEPDHTCKPLRQLIHMLVDIVAKGGNFLLNIGPKPDGTWTDEAYDRLNGIGEWMKINSEAIYDSRPIQPYKAGKVCFTRNKDSGSLYAVYLADVDEKLPPSKILLEHFQPSADAQVCMLGVEGRLKWDKAGRGCIIELPKFSSKNLPEEINEIV